MEGLGIQDVGFSASNLDFGPKVGIVDFRVVPGSVGLGFGIRHRP